MPLFSHKHITVSPNAQFALWSVDIAGYKKGDTFSAGPGVRVQKMVNGQRSANNIFDSADGPQHIYSHGEREGTVALIAMNTELALKILWGTGDIYYKDPETGVETSKVGINGTISLNVAQFSAFIDKGMNNLTADDLKRHIFTSLEGVVKEQLQKAINGKKYTELCDNNERLCDDILYYLQQQFNGLNIQAVTIGNIHFPDEFSEERKNKLSGGGFAELLGITLPEEKPKNTLLENAIAPFTQKSTGLYCPECGTEIEATQNFCHKCRYKIKTTF